MIFHANHVHEETTKHSLEGVPTPRLVLPPGVPRLEPEKYGVGVVLYVATYFRVMRALMIV